MKSCAETSPFFKSENKNIGQSERSAYKAAERTNSGIHDSFFSSAHTFSVLLFQASPRKLPEPFLLQCSILFQSFSSDLGVYGDERVGLLVKGRDGVETKVCAVLILLCVP